MKKWILILGVSFLSFSSFATDYTLNNRTCENFEGIEEDYNKEYPSTDDKLRYALCVLVKGKRVGDESLVEEGEKILKDLADKEGNVIASFYYGSFYYRKKNFGNEISEYNLNLVADYFKKTFDYLKKNPSYPNDEQTKWEDTSAIEIAVYSSLPTVHLRMYYLSIAGDFSYREGEDPESEKTFPNYRKGDRDGYITSAKEYAMACINLPWKKHFRETVGLFQEVCALELEMIDSLVAIQEDREEVLEKCGEDVSKEACREIHELNDKLSDKYISFYKEAEEIKLKEGGDLLYTASSG